MPSPGVSNVEETPGDTERLGQHLLEPQRLVSRGVALLIHGAKSCAGSAQSGLRRSLDPQPVFFVPVLDRQFGISVEALVTGTDLQLDPAGFVAQQQMHTR